MPVTSSDKQKLFWPDRAANEQSEPPHSLPAPKYHHGHITNGPGRSKATPHGGVEQLSRGGSGQWGQEGRRSGSESAWDNLLSREDPVPGPAGGAWAYAAPRLIHGPRGRACGHARLLGSKNIPRLPHGAPAGRSQRTGNLPNKRPSWALQNSKVRAHANAEEAEEGCPHYQR